MTINKIEKYLEKKVLFPLAEAFSQCIAYYQFLTFQVTFTLTNQKFWKEAPSAWCGFRFFVITE